MDSFHQPFGHTGLDLPRVVFGATSLGNLFVASSEQQKRELIAQWFEHLPKPVAIDTAGKYGAGLSLEVLGRELATLGVDPADVVISNKLAWRSVPLTTSEPTFEPGVWVDIDRDAVQDISAEGILRCWADGCDKLGRYRPQLLSVHDPDEYLAAAKDAEDRVARLEDIVAAHEALISLRDDGLASGVGVGAKDWRIIRELDRLCELDWVMFANSFTVMNHPSELIEFISDLSGRGVGVINSAVTHGGFLVGGDFLDYGPVDPSVAGHAKRLRWRESFVDYCRANQLAPYHVAVAYGLSHPGVASAALSTSRPERVGALVHAATHRLPAGTWRSMCDAGLITFAPA